MCKKNTLSLWVLMIILICGIVMKNHNKSDGIIHEISVESLSVRKNAIIHF